MNRHPDSRLIVYDGQNCCGKTTQFHLSSKYIYDKDRKYNVLLTREPTFGKYGLQIRQVLASGKDPFSVRDECFDLFVKDRFDHIDNHILPALEKGYIVLCDRYMYSTLSFQGAQGVGFEKMIQAHEGVLVPDLVLLFDLPIEIANERRRKRGELIKVTENEKIQPAVAENYRKMQSLLPNHPIKVIDATHSIEKIFEEVRNELNKVLPY